MVRLGVANSYQDVSTNRNWAMGLLCVSGMVVWSAYALLPAISNMTFWLIALIGTLGCIYLIGSVVIVMARWFLKPISLGVFHNACLLVSSLFVMVIGVEGVLGWHEQQFRQKRESHNSGEVLSSQVLSANLSSDVMSKVVTRENVVTLPPEWEWRSVAIPGAKRSYYWHMALHVHDENNFRRTTPFPQKSPRTFRIMIVGDSLTYGYGIDEKFTYSAILQRELEKEYHVETLNLGVSGHQSQDVLGKVQDFLPKLTPDLLIYGICLNDFLPSRKGQYRKRGYEVPIPVWFQDYVKKKTLVARFLDDLYDKSLRRFGLRADFFDDILNDFEGYQQRFGKDLEQINDFVIAHGLPPVITLVLDQRPRYGGRGYKISKVAEEYATQAGMDVIETEDFYRKFDGEWMRVSTWEGHPNEAANELFAQMILRKLKQHHSLRPFQKSK